MTTSAMLFAETHLKMGQGVRRVVSGRVSGGRFGTCVVRVWVSGGERHELRTRMLSATVTVLCAGNDSDLSDSTIK